MTREVLLITGPGGDAQGWGNMAVTEVLNDTINRLGFDYVERKLLEK